MRRFAALLLILTAACAPSSPSASTVSIDPAAADVAVDAYFADGYAHDLDPIVEASVGDVVSITFVGDVTDQIHIHGGYDIFVPVTPDETVSFAFVADHLGVVRVELEAAGYLLFELDVG